MKKNIGVTDRIIRILIGVAIAGAGIYYKSWWGIVALVPLVTAAIGYCPLWAMLKMDSAKKDTAPQMPQQPQAPQNPPMDGMGGGMQGPQM